MKRDEIAKMFFAALEKHNELIDRSYFDECTEGNECGIGTILFVLLFGHAPKYKLVNRFMKEMKLQTAEEQDQTTEDMNKFNKTVDTKASIQKALNYFSKDEEAFIHVDIQNQTIYIVKENFVYVRSPNTTANTAYDELKYREICMGLIEDKEIPARQKTAIQVMSNEDYRTRHIRIENTEIDIAANYNDDLPDKHIRDFLRSDEGGLVILHGEPGTGKTTYLKHLMSTLNEQCFVLMQAEALRTLPLSTLPRVLNDRNKVLVVEDCEQLMADRMKSGNGHLSKLLNLTDGLLGAALKPKIIFTASTNVANIDPAVLRKGRLKLMYEFKKLSEEKSERLMAKMGKKPTHKKMTLADIYNT